MAVVVVGPGDNPRLAAAQFLLNLYLGENLYSAERLADIAATKRRCWRRLG